MFLHTTGVLSAQATVAAHNVCALLGTYASNYKCRRTDATGPVHGTACLSFQVNNFGVNISRDDLGRDGPQAGLPDLTRHTWQFISQRIGL